MVKNIAPDQFLFVRFIFNLCSIFLFKNKKIIKIMSSKIKKLEIEKRKLQEELNNIYTNYYLVKKTPIFR